MKALVIGRFQPFHHGHRLLLEHIASQYDEIIIGIGSSQYGHTRDNPFTVDERRQMIEESLKQSRTTNYTIVLIPDIHNPPKWVDHVTSIVSDFDVVLSNNALTQELFTAKGYRVKEAPVFNRDQYSGKEIRRRIRDDEPWEELVPEPVARIIRQVAGVERIKQATK